MNVEIYSKMLGLLPSDFLQKLKYMSQLVSTNIINEVGILCHYYHRYNDKHSKQNFINAVQALIDSHYPKPEIVCVDSNFVPRPNQEISYGIANIMGA